MKSSGKALVWVLLGVGALVFALCAFGGWAIWRTILGGPNDAARQLPEERAAAKREGLPLTSEELFRRRPLDPKTNAGPALAKELAAVRRISPSETTTRVFGAIAKGIAGDDLRSEARGLLAKAKPHLEAILAASKLPECDFGKDYGQGTSVLFPELVGIKIAVKMLAGRANLEARAGDFAGAERDIATSFRLAESAGKEPCVIGALVQIACNTITHAGLREILRKHPNEALAIRLGQHATSLAVHVDFRRAFEGELVIGRATILNLRSMKEVQAFSEQNSSGSEERRRLDTYSVGFSRMRDAFETRHLQFWRRVFARMPKGQTDYLPLGAVMREETAKEERHLDVSYLLNMILVPVFDDAVLAGCRDLADQSITEGFWRLLAYRKQHGDFPDKLGQLGVKLTDPLDGQPLRYRKRTNGFLLYSIDRDRKDDGGVMPRPGQSGGPRDLVAQFP